MCDSVHGMLEHIFKISLLTFFMVLPGALENTAVAETHIPGSGSGRPFAEGGAYGGATSGLGPCSPISNSSNVANPSFNVPINPVVPPAGQPAVQPSTATTSSTASTGGGDAARGATSHGGSCNGCHSADKYPISAQIDAIQSGRMPKGQPLSEGEKADIIAFLKTKG